MVHWWSGFELFVLRTLKYIIRPVKASKLEARGRGAEWIDQSITSLLSQSYTSFLKDVFLRMHTP